jgi:hypothetical protein
LRNAHGETPLFADGRELLVSEVVDEEEGEGA